MIYLFYLFIIIAITINSCSYEQENAEREGNVESKDDIECDFMNRCSYLQLSFGSLQCIYGKVAKDSLTLMVYGECYDTINPYIVQWAPKMELDQWREIIKGDTIFKYLKNERLKGFPNLDYYVFVLQNLTDPDQMEDTHDCNIFFPQIVKIFKHKDISCEFIDSLEVIDISQLQMLRFKAFFRQL